MRILGTAVEIWDLERYFELLLIDCCSLSDNESYFTRSLIAQAPSVSVPGEPARSNP